MPFKPEIRQATGLFAAGTPVQLAHVAATTLCAQSLRESAAPDGAFPDAVQRSPLLRARALTVWLAPHNHRLPGAPRYAFVQRSSWESP